MYASIWSTFKCLTGGLEFIFTPSITNSITVTRPKNQTLAEKNSPASSSTCRSPLYYLNKSVNSGAVVSYVHARPRTVETRLSPNKSETQLHQYHVEYLYFCHWVHGYLWDISAVPKSQFLLDIMSQYILGNERKLFMLHKAHSNWHTVSWIALH
jgi:hypothetical protein